MLDVLLYAMSRQLRMVGRKNKAKIHPTSKQLPVTPQSQPRRYFGSLSLLKAFNQMLC